MDLAAERIEETLPGLRGKAWQITSPASSLYNCIAWAAGDTAQWWWPSASSEDAYWPDSVERTETMAAFMAVFSLLGFELCATADPETGYEKIALFASPDRIPTHAARQLPNGRWTSKLGRGEDIEHELHDISGAIYGSVVQLLRRSLRTVSI